eukprot:2961683-Amphidinium_carterae.1
MYRPGVRQHKGHFQAAEAYSPGVSEIWPPGRPPLAMQTEILFSALDICWRARRSGAMFWALLMAACLRVCSCSAARPDPAPPERTCDEMSAGMEFRMH